MIAIDPYIIEFVTKNPVTIGLGLATLKVIAKLTPGTTDDKIVTLLGNMFRAVRPKEKAIES
ncbi:MAG: hypothetical protein JRI34_05615 [Deltaproteobacteria bacterium]|nr:hypothetical protein [Deltaproteobacteria bacterium]